MPIPKIYKPEEARQLMNIGRSQFYELLRQGRIRSIRNGRRYLIPESSILEFISSETDEKAGAYNG